MKWNQQACHISKIYFTVD